MPAVFVHGVPETDAIWSPLLAELKRDDVICLSPPGFGAPCPPGWESSPGAYAAWLIAELERIGESIDLVGHDWGGGHVINALVERPDLVRSWVSDVLGIFHPDYVWHDMAQTWRTPGDGEAAVEAMVGASLDDRKAMFGALGLDGLDLDALGSAVNDDMGKSILGLYRGAEPAELSAMYDRLGRLASVPGLTVVATEDHYTGGEEMARHCAEAAGASVHRLDSLGHWWMVEDPARSAAMLTDFWSTASGAN